MAVNVSTASELTQEQVQRILVQPLEATAVFLAAGPRIFDTNGSQVRVPKMGQLVTYDASGNPAPAEPTGSVRANSSPRKTPTSGGRPPAEHHEVDQGHHAVLERDGRQSIVSSTRRLGTASSVMSQPNWTSSSWGSAVTGPQPRSGCSRGTARSRWTLPVVPSPSTCFTTLGEQPSAPTSA